ELVPVVMGHGLRRDDDCYAASLNVTPQRSNVSPSTLHPFALAASRTFTTSATRNVNPVIRSTGPFTNRNTTFGSFSTGPSAPLVAATPMILPQCSASPCGSGLCISTSVSASVVSLRIDFCQSGPAGG